MQVEKLDLSFNTFLSCTNPTFFKYLKLFKPLKTTFLSSVGLTFKMGVTILKARKQLVQGYDNYLSFIMSMYLFRVSNSILALIGAAVYDKY
jgi:hypothetical protein